MLLNFLIRELQMINDYNFVTYFSKFSQKFVHKVLHPKSCGFFKEQAYKNSQMRLVIGKEGSLEEGMSVEIYLVVDESDGILADFKYQCFGPTVLVATLESLAELSLRKNYLQASRISYELVDKHLREKQDKTGIPLDCFSAVNFCLSAFFMALDQCDDIPLLDSQLPPPSPIDLDASLEHGYPNFLELTQEEKFKVCEEIINRDIRPYVQLDEGNVVIKKIDGYLITIIYQGSCTSCFSATGSTLNAIQQILKAKINPNIIVTPDLSNLGGIT